MMQEKKKDGMSGQPLAGLRVLDMSHVIAGPLTSFYLAQMGAEVIKIESPVGGDVMRSGKTTGGGEMPEGFVALNAGKRSLAVDIRTPEGADLVRQLARTADVFIENFRPGVVARYGLDYPSIQAVKPDIVYCSISGYGQQGAWSRRGAYDHVIQALTGMMMMNGDSADAPPMKVGFPVIDIAVGMLGSMSVLGALHRRDRHGVGQYIDTSMAEASMMLMYPHASSFLTNRVEPQRVGNRGYTGSPTADTYCCRDGWLATAANTPAQFRKLTDVLSLQELCSDAEALDLDAFNAPGGGFVVARNLAYLQRRLCDAFAEQSASDMEERLNAVGVPAARVRRLGEFIDEAASPGCLNFRPSEFAQGMQTVRTPGLGFRYRYAGAPTKAGAPRHGQDTNALLGELGLSDERIDALRRVGAIR
jgi:crotonobetainyl-CoA:carnitine CoA-transferase CaiB-like acyl-CoA transferase